MRSRWLRDGASAAAFLASLCSGPAGASVTAKLIGNTVSASSAGLPYTTPQSALVDYNQGSGDWSGVSVNAMSNLTDTDIEFRNGIAAMGTNTIVQARTGVAITFTNDESFAVRPVLDSTLLAAGVGVYLTASLPTSDSGSYPAGSCNSGGLVNCGSPADAVTGNIGWMLSQFGRTVGLPAFGQNSAGFDFDVSVGGQSIYSLGGSVGVGADGQFHENLDAAKAVLSDFKTTSSPFADTYSWGDTGVTIALPNMLAPGQSVTAVYTITTYASIGVDGDQISSDWSDTNQPWTIAAPIAYAAFGDPVGRAGTINPNAVALSNLFAVPQAEHSDDLSTGLDTSAVAHFSLPSATVDPITHDYVATITGSTYRDPLAALPAVPEPANWALMLVGFGMAGAALRRRSRADQTSSSALI
jgi:hypothetical protein